MLGKLSRHAWIVLLPLVTGFVLCAALIYMLGSAQAQASLHTAIQPDSSTKYASFEGAQLAASAPGGEEAAALQAAAKADKQALLRSQQAAQQSYLFYQNSLRAQAGQDAANGLKALVAAQHASALAPASSLYKPIVVQKPAAITQPPEPARLQASAASKASQALPNKKPAASEVKPAHAAGVTAGPYYMDLAPIHLNHDPGGLSSAFVLTNTGASIAVYEFTYLAPNGDLVNSTVGPNLNPGQSDSVDLATFNDMGSHFFGYVVISSDNPFDARILTPDYGVIGGRTYQTDGVTAQSGIGITVFDQDGMGIKTGTGSSTDGSFYVGGLPQGHYYLQINTDAPWASGFYNNAINHNDAYIFDVHYDNPLTATNVILQPGGNIYGSVVASDGSTPLANVNVDLDQGWWGQCTDALGHYTLRGVPYGTNYVRAGGGNNWCTGSDSPYIQQYYHDAPDRSSAQPIVLSSTTPGVGGINFTMTSGGRIAGRVTQLAGGGGVGGVGVVAYIQNGPKVSTNTDPSGTYTLTGMTAGDYIVFVDSNSLPSGLGAIYYPDAIASGNAIPVHVDTGGLVTGIDMALPVGGEIHGHIADQYGAPLANVSINADMQGINEGKGNCTDSSGDYVFHGLPYATYAVHYWGGWDNCRGQQSLYYPQYYDDAINIKDATLLDIGSAQNVYTGIDFTLRPGGEIHGRVTSQQSGAPLGNLWVNVFEYNKDGSKFAFQTDAAGYYTASALAPVDYYVYVDRSNVPAGYAQLYYPDTIFSFNAGSIHVTAGQVVNGIDLALPPGGVISGRVVAKDGGLPIANLNVSANMNNQPMGMGGCTDGDGYFNLSGLPFFSYSLTAAQGWNYCQNGVTLFAPQWYSHTYKDREAIPLVLDAGQPSFGGINFALEPGAYIKGFVKDGGGSPLSPVTVQAGYLNGDCQDCWSNIDGRWTSPDGSYFIGPLPPIDQILWACATCNGLNYIDQFYPGVPNARDAQVFHLQPGEVITPANFTLVQGGTLTGRITEAATGQGAPNVRANAYVPNQPIGSGAWTDAQGYYTMTGMSSGDYVLTVDEYNLPLGLGRIYYPNSITLDNADRLHVTAGSVLNGYNLALPAGGRMQGQVMDAGGSPLANVAVQIDFVGTNEGRGACTDGSGNFTLYGLVYFSYRARSGGDWDFCRNQNSPYIRQYYNHVTDQDQATLVDINAGNNDPVDINFNLTVGSQITGQVTDASTGLPVANVNVQANDTVNDNTITGANTDGDGNYIISGLPAGVYHVKVEAHSLPAGLGQIYYPNTVNWQQAGVIDLAAGQTIPGIDLALPPGGGMTGRIVDKHTGQPLVNVNVSAGIVDIPMGVGSCTDQNGYYSLPGLPYGTYVANSGGGWDWCQNQPSLYAQTMYSDTYQWNQAVRLNVGSGQAFYDNINFDMEPGAYVQGSVVNDSGDPVANLQVNAGYLNGQCPDCWDGTGSVQTGPDGSYNLGPLPPTDLFVHTCPACNNLLYYEQFYSGTLTASTAHMFHLTPGQTVQGINFTMHPGTIVSGTVSVPAGISNENLQVDIWANGSSNFGTGTRTDSQGLYQISLPPVGDWYWSVAARPWGTDLGSQWANNVELMNQRRWDFNLVPGGSLHGCVTDGSLPVTNVWVNANTPSMGQGSGTGPDGCYTITNLPPADYTVDASGWPEHVYTAYGLPNGALRLPVRVKAGKSPQVDFVMPPAGQVTGHIYSSANGQPVSKARVVAINSQGFWENNSQSDGSFSVDLPAGQYKLIALSPDWSQFGAVYHTNLAFPLDQDWAHALTITVPAISAGAFQADLNLPARGVIHGTVTDAANGQPLGGIHVAALSKSYPDPLTNAWWNGCTGPDGQYTLQGVQPGSVEIMAVGMCTGRDYGAYTQTVVMAQGGDLSANIALTDRGPRPANQPFTVLTEDDYDHSPFVVGYNDGTVYESENVVAALFTPLAYPDDTGAWRSDLLASIPSLDNGAAGMIADQWVVTYTLKSGLAWSDGAPLTSADIAFTWRMLTEPNPLVNYGSQGLFFIQKIDTPNPQTAVVTFRPDWYSANYLLALQYLLPQHTLQGHHMLDWMYASTFSNLPTGNGPYVAQSYIPGAWLDVRANPNYARQSEGLPRITTARFTFQGHPFYFTSYGMADVATAAQNAGLPADYASQGLQAVTNETGGIEFLNLNNERPQFQDARVRKALLLALDRQTPASLEPLGSTAIGYNYLPVGNAFNDPTVPQVPFDLAQAASLLDSAGWIDHDADGIRDKGGVKLSFTLSFNQSNAYRSNLAPKYQADLASIGVDLHLQAYTDFEAYFNDNRRDKQDANLVMWSGYSRFDTTFIAQLSSLQIPTGYNGFNMNNFTRWSDTTNDALIDATRSPQSFASLLSAYLAHQDYYAAQTPALPTRHTTRVDLARPELLNFKPTGMAPVTWNMAEWSLPDNPYDLAVHVSLAPGSPAPQPGQVITYQVSVQNSGYFTVTGALLADTLPSQASFLRAVPARDPGSLPPQGGELYWSLGAIGPRSEKTVRVAVSLSAALLHGDTLLDTAQVSQDQADTRPGNNGYSLSLTIHLKPDLSIAMSGVGQPVVGEHFDYYLDYANLGGAPVTGAVVTDTLPAEVTFQGATPPPTTINGQVLTWSLPQLAPNQWGGRISLHTIIDNPGSTVTNQARIGAGLAEDSYANNTSSYSMQVTSVLPPVITRPTTGVTDGTPTFAGLAPAGSTVRLYNVAGGSALLLGTTTATITGTFRVELSLPEGLYIIQAKAKKGALVSGYSNSVTFNVQLDLALDPDYVTITDAGVDVSNGAVRTQRRLRAHSLVTFDTRLPCSSLPEAYLEVTENGAYHTDLAPVALDDLGAGQWHAHFELWIANPHSSYNVAVHWNCGGTIYRELLVYILIDPDGYVFDQSLVSAGGTMTDSLVSSAVITAYVKTGADWVVWPAGLYGQSNPQSTDGATPDGVLTPGYYSFMTPAGQYRISAHAPGFQPYESPVMTVITTPVHLDIGLLPVQTGSGVVFQPANLSAATLDASAAQAKLGEVITYTLNLPNSGGAAASLVVKDVLPLQVELVSGSLQASTGLVSYDPATRTIEWKPTALAGGQARLSFRLKVVHISTSVFTWHNTLQVSGAQEILQTLPDLKIDLVILPGHLIYLPVTVKH